MIHEWTLEAACPLAGTTDHSAESGNRGSGVTFLSYAGHKDAVHLDSQLLFSMSITPFLALEILVLRPPYTTRIIIMKIIPTAGSFTSALAQGLEGPLKNIDSAACGVWYISISTKVHRVDEKTAKF